MDEFFLDAVRGWCALPWVEKATPGISDNKDKVLSLLVLVHGASLGGYSGNPLFCF